MAPNRRKGANKAAAAAAARRKWKVGDLVLAKVKGFPAWPATVSEPQKWGYPADLKKIVVFFFGTQQIAFCNPVDIEEFTEEKKVSLLGKRHGKGADFVRAVKEISDCYDELKKHGQISSANGTEETNSTDGNHSERSSSKYEKNEYPIVDPPSGETTNDLNSLTEAAVAEEAMDALPVGGIHKEEPFTLVFPETPVPSAYSTRSKIDVARLRNSGSQQNKSARRLRSFSRINGSVLPPVNSNRASRVSGKQGRSLRRSRRFMKSSDDFEGQDSLAFVSNDSTEESDSEIMMADSDTRCVNAGSADVLGCKSMDAELLVEKNVDVTDSNGKIDFQTNFVFKRRNIPASRGHNNDKLEATELEAIASEVKVLNNGCISPRFSEKLIKRNAKDDSDEHLPFAKRARVRLGKPLSAPKEEITLAHKEEDMLIFPENPTVQSPELMSCKVDVSADKRSSPTKENLPNSPLSCASPAKIPQLRETGKNVVDGEAALPPSKRLHRALEAMCANVAKDCDKACDYSLSPGIQRSEPCPVTESSELSLGKNAVVELRSGAVEDLSNGDPPLSTSKLCAVSNLEISGNNIKSNVVSDCGQTGCLESVNILYEHAECADSKHLQRSPSNRVHSEISSVHHVRPDSVDASEQLNHSNCDTLVLAVTHLCENELAELNGKGSDTNTTHMNSDSVFVKDIAVGSPNIDKSIIVKDINFANGETEKTKCLPIGENKKDTMSDFVKASQRALLDPSMMHTISPAKISARSDQQFPVHSNSVCPDHMDDRTVSVTQSSSSPTDGPDSVARASPPSSSACNISVSDNTNNTHENNSSCSPDVRLHLEKAKLAGKSSSKWESLSSFEKFIKSLTRTKESIGRATRMAIDCAKSGLAAKVVDILVHNLESESSLRKKVDLFFLVDSITQCSRGMKGDCDIYPSAIQTLLPRLLLAAAPPGSSSHENQRQCLKVLRVWQERKILPEPIIRHHIQQLDALCGSYPISSSRPLRNERAFDDPVREMEGMLVDEYGSNSSVQLPGFCMPPMLRNDDGGSESDGEGFEAVTPEHNVENGNEDKTPIHAVQKRSHILEDVDGELEMEDEAPCCEVEGNGVGEDSHMQIPHHQFDIHYGTPLITQPKHVPPAVVSMSGSPLPLPPPPPPPSHPPPPPPPPPSVVNHVRNGHGSKPYSSSQNFNISLQDSFASQSVLPRVLPTPVDAGYHRVHEFEAQVPRWMPDSNYACLSGDRPNSHLSGTASSVVQPTDNCSKGFHLRPPLPAPSNQFSYVQEPRIQSRREIPHPHSNQFRTCNAENGNFYRECDRNEFVPRDNIGECWRPPLPPVSGPGPYYPDQPRMVHTPIYDGPPRDPALPNNRWNFPPPLMNQGHFHPYRPPVDGPIPVANKGPNFWRPR